MERKVICKIRNLTGGPLTLTSSQLNHGKWSESGDKQPEIQIQDKTTGTFEAQKKTGGAYGVTGTVVYSTRYGNEYTFYFDNPYSGDNNENVTCNNNGSTGCGSFTIKRMDLAFTNEVSINQTGQRTFQRKGQPYEINYEIREIASTVTR